MATALNFPSADVDILIQGDDNAQRTITFGQQGTFKDRVVIASEFWSVDVTGLAKFSKIQNGDGSNTLYGAGALAAIAGGTGNITIGAGAGDLITSGSNNVLIGDTVGDNLVTGGSNILIGTNLDATASSTTGELRIHHTSGVPLVSGDMVLGLLGVNTLAKRSATLNITTDVSDAVDCLLLDQDDDSEAMLSIEATSAASTVNPVTSFTAGATIQGFFRTKINGTDRWVPFYDDPTS